MIKLINDYIKNVDNGQCAGSICRETRTVQWFTYSDLLTRIKHFGDGLISLKQQPAKSVIGMFCRNRIEYMIAEFGCYWHSLIIATIYDTLGPNVCTFVANQGNSNTSFRLIKIITHQMGIILQRKLNSSFAIRSIECRPFFRKRQASNI